MRFEGILTAWNAERGYGSITPLQGGQELFVHISAFPADGAVPSLGEVLNFEIVTGRDDRKEVARVQRSKRLQPTAEEKVLGAAAPRRRRHEERRRRLAVSLVALLQAVGGLGWLHLSQGEGQQVAQRHTAKLR